MDAADLREGLNLAVAALLTALAYAAAEALGWPPAVRWLLVSLAALLAALAAVEDLRERRRGDAALDRALGDGVGYAGFSDLPEAEPAGRGLSLSLDRVAVDEAFLYQQFTDVVGWLDSEVAAAEWPQALTRAALRADYRTIAADTRDLARAGAATWPEAEPEEDLTPIERETRRILVDRGFRSEFSDLLDRWDREAADLDALWARAQGEVASWSA